MLYIAFPLNAVKIEEARPDSGSKVDSQEGGADKPVEAYYPGTEITGFMPHRGDFANVSRPLEV